MMGNQKVAMEITGQKFGKLAVIKRMGSDRHSKSVWLCRCECGRQIVTEGSSLRKGNTKSCGCVGAKKNAARLKDWHMFGEENPKYVHGESHKTLEYGAYCNMRSRCNNPHVRSYPDYGGRGIKVCSRWSGPKGYLHFLADMGRKPSAKHQLDRIDVNSDYEPKNCRWATPLEQANNTRRRRLEDFSDADIKNEFIRRGISL